MLSFSFILVILLTAWYDYKIIHFAIVEIVSSAFHKGTYNNCMFVINVYVCAWVYIYKDTSKFRKLDFFNW